MAWPAVSLLVVLLPGFFFFVGLYSRELYGRDASARDVVSQLAPIVFVSILVHATLIFAARVLPFVPAVNLSSFLSVIQPGDKPDANPAAAASILERSAGWIVVYVVAGSALGALSGWLVAGLVIAGKLKFGVAYPWAYELSAQSEKEISPTYAFVLTKLKRGNANELYRGPLGRFGLTADGRFSYLVLLEPEKCKVVRDDQGTTRRFTWRSVGESTAAPVWSRALYLDMADVANVVFEKYPRITALDVPALMRAIENREKKADPTPAR